MKPTGRAPNGSFTYTMDCKINCVRRADVGYSSDFEAVHSVRAAESSPPVKLTDDEETDGETSPNSLVRERWRLLSCVAAWPQTHHATPQLVDYGVDDGAALRVLVNLVNSKPVNLTWDHSDRVKDVAGRVENAAWEPPSDIPAGVNADLVVDPAFDSKAAVGLKNGFLRAGSIGITAQVVPSHPDIPMEQFLSSQGREIKREVCRWIVQSIDSVSHFAFVTEGADPNAGPLNNSAHTERFDLAHKIASIPDVAWEMRASVDPSPESIFVTVQELLSAASVTDNRLKELVKLITEAVPGAMIGLPGIDHSNARQLLGKCHVFAARKWLELLLTEGPKIVAMKENVKARIEELRHAGRVYYSVANCDPRADKMLTDDQTEVFEQISNSNDIAWLQKTVNQWQSVVWAKSGMKPPAGPPMPPGGRVSIGEDLPTERALWNHNGKIDYSAIERGVAGIFGTKTT